MSPDVIADAAYGVGPDEDLGSRGLVRWSGPRAAARSGRRIRQT